MVLDWVPTVVLDCVPITNRPRNAFLAPLQLVSGAYFPFLGSIVLASAGLGTLVLIKSHGLLAISVGGLLLLVSGHIVVGLLALFRGVEEKDEFEIELPDKRQPGLAKLVEQVASERGLVPPDVIRLHAQSLAHVYLDRDGKRSWRSAEHSLRFYRNGHWRGSSPTSCRTSPPATSNGRDWPGTGTASWRTCRKSS